MTQQKNLEIRKAAKEAGVRFWQIAEYLGVAESGLSRRMRHELPREEKQQIIDAIQQLQGASA